MDSVAGELGHSSTLRLLPLGCTRSNESMGRGVPLRTHWLSRKTVRVTFELPAEAWALVERALEGARQASGGGLSDAEALQAVARDALAGQTTGGDASDPRRAVVLYECTNCGRSELETGAGGLELDAAGAAAFSCGATAHDLASEGRTVTRGGPLPAAVRRAVLLRDRCRCRVPGCARRRYVEVHHLTAQALGGEHSRRNCLVLCTTHHELLHDGKLTVAGDAEHELSFYDANGRPMVAARSIATQLGTLRDVSLDTTHLGTLRNVSLDATQLGLSRGVGLVASQLGLAVEAHPGNATHDDSAAEYGDRATYAGLQLESGLLAPGRRLLEVMGRRGSWNMDALCESSGLAARDVAAALTLLELDGQVRGHDGIFDPV